jgi:hypothetical protein
MKDIDQNVSILFGKMEKENTSNPLFTEVKVHVLYSGLNRNGTYIGKNLAEKMGSKIGYTPIIGEFLTKKDDFGSHGGKMVISSEGVEFEKTTVPYGVVNAEKGYWWEEVEGPDGVVRNFLTVSAYLWTAKYPEVDRVASGNNWQSMELNRDFSVGEWITRKDGSYYFKFTDAVIEALCILGNDVEPCFEGASFKTPNSEFAMQDFKSQFELMMTEFKNALEKEVDLQMENIETKELDNLEIEAEIIETEVETEVVETEFEAAEVVEDEVETIEEVETEIEEVEIEVEHSLDEGTEGEENNSVTEELLTEYTDKISSLEAELSSLKEKLVVYEAKEALEQKEALLAKFSTALDVEIIEGFKEKIDSFSVGDLKAKLAETLSEQILNGTPSSTFSLGTDLNRMTETRKTQVPEWVQALRK